MRVVAVNSEFKSDRNALAWVARSALLAKVDGVPIGEVVQRLGDRLPAKAGTIIKAAVDTGSTTGWGSSLVPDAEIAQDGFVSLARSSSAFFELLASGAMRRTPLRTRLAITTTAATGFIRGEGSARPISKLALANTTGLMPIEAVALLVVSDELTRSTSPAAAALFNTELAAAVGAVADERFIAIVEAAKAATAVSYGSTAFAARADIQAMMAAITTDARSRLVWIGGVDVAKGATVLTDNDGAYVFPDMSPTGGTMLKIPFIVSGAVDADALYLVDADKIAANADPVTFDIFREATIEMEDAPDSPTVAGTTMFNLWQNDCSALLASTYIAAEVRTQTAIAETTGITWGEFAPDSPT
jgi:HK97 family phage major capsid protein